MHPAQANLKRERDGREERCKKRDYHPGEEHCDKLLTHTDAKAIGKGPAGETKRSRKEL